MTQDITTRGTERVYAIRVSNSQAFLQARLDMKKEKKRYLPFLKMSAKSFGNFFPKIETIQIQK